VRHRGSRPIVATIAGVLFLLTPPSAAAQAPTKTAKPWQPSRTPDGQPDIQGFWNREKIQQVNENLQQDPESPNLCTFDELVRLDKGGMKPTKASQAIVDPPDGQIPYQPWTAAIRKQRLDNHLSPDPKLRDPVNSCFLVGVPRTQYQSEVQIVQTAGYVVLLFDFNHTNRIIALDGRPQLPENMKLWMGQSRGRWEGNTLVVDVTNLNDRTWLDRAGNFHTDALRVVERWTFVNPDMIRYEATLDDPKAYTRPWKIAFNIDRIKEAGYEFLENACHEGTSTAPFTQNSPIEKPAQSPR